MTEIVKKEDKRNKRIFLILLLILLIAVGVTIWALFFRDGTIDPDYAALDDEKYAVDIGDGGEKLEQESGGGAVSLTYSTDVDVDLSEEVASLMFANPYKSNQDMVLQIVVKDTVIAQSGKIAPGKKIEKLDLTSGADEKLQIGGYDGEFKLLYYQPDTHERTVVNTEIPIKVNVKE